MPAPPSLPPCLPACLPTPEQSRHSAEQRGGRRALASRGGCRLPIPPVRNPAGKVQRAVSLFSLHDATLSPDIPPAHSPVLGHLSLERQLTPRTTPTMSEEPSVDLTGKVYQLEAMLKQLHSDLQKEKQDKVVLQAEVASLRHNNQRLQEESQTANEQLRKFAEIFSSAVEKKEL